uniref:Putative capsid protein n=1 Tax=uncultured virus TaxID=340016 RepID=A0A2H4YQ42_9VIRU|nr:putative capsid protein [uncultured virus]
MPYVYKKKRRSRRGKGAKKRSSRRSRNYTRSSGNRAIISGGSIVPVKSKHLFKYAERITMNPVSGGVGTSYFFSTNSLFDPNRSGLGHQPYGFDQYVGVLYDHYTVIGSKITVTAVNRGAVSTDPVIMAITERDTFTATTNIEHLIEMGNNTYTFCGVSDGGAGIATLSYNSNPAKFLGRSKPLADSELKGSVSTNPAEESFFEIVMASTGTNDPGALDVLVNIEYIAVLTEPKRFTQS